MSAPCLLAAWRDPGPISDETAADLNALLLGPVTIPLRGWPDDVRHRSPKVVGVGIAYATSGKVLGPAADVVFSAVLLRALRGDRAAELVLSHARRRIAAGEPATKRIIP